jgi:oligo-1,6-glucosidase
MLRGLPFIYQGQEIGMENTVFSSLDDFDDVGTIGEYQVSVDAGLSEEEALSVASTYSRDNARTPMQWSAEYYAGFSEADPWLPVNPNYKLINVHEQAERQDSVFNFYRQLIALRKDPDYRETLVWGEFEPVYEERKGLMAYCRRADRDLLILANLKSEPETIDVGCEYRVLLDNLNPSVTPEQTQTCIKLQAWQGVVLELLQ